MRNAIQIHTGRPETDPRYLARQEMPVGRQIVAHIDATGTSITLTRTDTTTYRVVVLDAWSNIIDRAWNRNFTDEQSARHYARACTVNFRPRTSTVATFVRAAELVAA